MAINLGTEITQGLEDQGAITTGTTLGGDLSGTMPNPTIANLNGTPLLTTLLDGHSLTYSSTNSRWEPQFRIGESSNFSGDIAGNYASGFTVDGIQGVAVAAAPTTAGQVMKYDGSEIVWDADSEGETTVIATSTVTAANKQIIRANSTSAAFTITAPSSPIAGDYFKVYDTHGQAGTNAITIAVATGDSLEGTIDDTLSIDVNNAIVELYYNGTTWKYYVPYVRP